MRCPIWEQRSRRHPLRCHTLQLFIRVTLRPEALASEEPGDGLWSIDCDEVLRARLAARDVRLYA
jgi:hypothetical protein